MTNGIDHHRSAVRQGALNLRHDVTTYLEAFLCSALLVIAGSPVIVFTDPSPAVLVGQQLCQRRLPAATRAREDQHVLVHVIVRTVPQGWSGSPSKGRLHVLWQFYGPKISFGKEVILTGLIDHPKLFVLLSLRVRDQLVNLANLERSLVAIISHTNDEPLDASFGHDH